MFLKKITSLLFLIGFCLVMNGQDKDSLLNVIKKYKFNDTIQCNRILSYVELEEDSDKWLVYNKKLLVLVENKLKMNLSSSERKKYNYYLGNYYNNDGFFLYNILNYDKALISYNKAETIFRNNNFKSDLAMVYQNIGTLYSSKGQTSKVLYYYDKTLKLKLFTKDSIGISNIYADLGNFYAENGSDSKALNYFMKSLKISERLKDESALNRAKNYMSSIYRRQGEYQIAAKFYLENLSYFKKINNTFQVAETYHNLAAIYSYLNEVDLMNLCEKECLKIAFKKNYTTIIAFAFGNKRDYFLKTKQIDSAYKYSKLEYKFYLISNEEPNLTKSKIRLSVVCKFKNLLNDAKKIGIEAYNNSILLKSPKMTLDASRNLKEIYIKLSDKENTLKYALIEIDLNNSLSALNSKNSAIKSLFKYETEKKESQITELSQKKKIAELESKRKTSLLLIFGIFFLAIATTGYVLFTRFKTKKQNEQLAAELAETQKLLEAEKKVTDSELKALKSQMNPHFIFNALNSIQSQFMYGDKYLANEQLNNFTYLTRQILEVSGKKQIALADEIDILTKYLDLEKMRFGKDLTFEITTTQNIDPDYHKIPPMLLQHIVENSIKHGLLHQVGDKNVSVNFDISKDESYLICSVLDNGIGRQQSAVIKSKSNLNHNSFSTNALEERLELLNKNLKLKDLIVYEDVLNDKNDVCGTRVILKIPLV